MARNKLRDCACTASLLVVLILTVPYGVTNADTWPVPYRRFTSRPPSDSFCEAKYAFCPTGFEKGGIPLMEDTDLVDVFAMKKPMFEFAYGDLLGKFNMFHDAIGFCNKRTQLNYTMEWYELFEIGNCTFPHVRNGSELTWCNQGANCWYDGIVDNLWTENGTIVKVAEISGKTFNNFAQWAIWDNNTGIYYETWSVASAPGGQTWFESYDCASFVLRAFDQLHLLGAAFDTSVHLNYSRISLYSSTPIYLGNSTTIFGPTGNVTLATSIVKFYSDFQPHQSLPKLIANIVHAFETIVIEHKFYLFYNYEYWYLPMKAPYLRFTYDRIPLPGFKK